MKRRVVLTAALLAGPLRVSAKSELELGGVALLQPDGVIQQRVATVESFASYLEGLEAALRVYYDAQPQGVRRSGYVVVAVKPARQSNVWLDFTPKLPPAEASELVARLRHVMPMPVTQGPVVFAMQIGIGGAMPPTDTNPKPDEWVAESAKVGQPIEVGELVLRVWRD